MSNADRPGKCPETPKDPLVYPGGQTEGDSLDLDELEDRVNGGLGVSIPELRHLISALRLEQERSRYFAETHGERRERAPLDGGPVYRPGDPAPYERAAFEGELAALRKVAEAAEAFARSAGGEGDAVYGVSWRRLKALRAALRMANVLPKGEGDGHV